MTSLTILLISIYFPILLIFIGSGLYLLKRAEITNLDALNYLGAFFLFTAGNYIFILLSSFEWDMAFFIAPILLTISIVMALLFAKNAFYLKNNLIFNTLIIITVSFGFLSQIFAYLQTMDAFSDIGRLGRTFFSNIMIIFSATWHAKLAIRDYIRFSNKPVEKYIQMRYLLFGITSIIGITISIIDMLGTVLEINGMAQYEITLSILMMITLVYVLLNFLVWVMPEKFRKFLNGASHASIGKDKNVPVAGKTRAYKIIDYYGNILSPIIGKTRDACKGLILVATIEVLGENGIYKLDLQSLITIFDISLRKSMEKLNLSNIDTIIKTLINDIKENKSLFLVTNT